jgi:hypothetical protein
MVCASLVEVAAGGSGGFSAACLAAREPGSRVSRRIERTRVFLMVYLL